METKEILKKVRKIEIKTKRLSNDIFGGEYHSSFKGRGMTFLKLDSISLETMSERSIGTLPHDIMNLISKFLRKSVS